MSLTNYTRYEDSKDKLMALMNDMDMPRTAQNKLLGYFQRSRHAASMAR